MRPLLIWRTIVVEKRQVPQDVRPKTFTSQDVHLTRRLPQDIALKHRLKASPLVQGLGGVLPTAIRGAMKLLTEATMVLAVWSRQAGSFIISASALDER